MTFDDDAENILRSALMYLQVANIYTYIGYQKLKSTF